MNVTLKECLEGMATEIRWGVSDAVDHSVKFTIGRLFTSDDKTWDKNGVIPDVEVPNTESKGKRDHQLELAKLLITKK